MFRNSDFHILAAALADFFQQFIRNALEFTEAFANFHLQGSEPVQCKSGFLLLLIEGRLIPVITGLRTFDDLISFRMLLITVIAFLGSVSSGGQRGCADDKW